MHRGHKNGGGNRIDPTIVLYLYQEARAKNL